MRYNVIIQDLRNIRIQVTIHKNKIENILFQQMRYFLLRNVFLLLMKFLLNEFFFMNDYLN